jgi:hypothetical protein
MILAKSARALRFHEDSQLPEQLPRQVDEELEQVDDEPAEKLPFFVFEEALLKRLTPREHIPDEELEWLNKSLLEQLS